MANRPLGTQPDTPALRFLKRGKQLGSLAQRALAQVRAEVETDESTWDGQAPKSPEDVRSFVEVVTEGLGRSRERLSDVELMVQLFYARHVDNFQIFLEELLEAILVTQPGLLKRGDPVPLEEVFRYADMDSFRRAMTDRRIRALAYKSIEDLVQIVKTEMAFDLFPQASTKETVVQLFDRRNLLTHNYGIVNRWFLTRYPHSGLEVGQPFPYDPASIQPEIQTLASASTDIERRAKHKFKLFQN